jgi:drug/metabolite transporter (DMT)-like permease
MGWQPGHWWVSGGAGKTSVLVYTMPLWTLIFAWFFLNERIRGIQWFAIGLSIVGLLFILDPMNLGGTIASKVLAVLAGLSWAAGAVIAKKLRQEVELDLLSFTAWQMVAGAVVLAPVALLEPSKPIVWATPFVFALVYNVIPGTAIAALLWLFVLNRLPAGTAGLGVLLNPVVGVIAARLQLGETPETIEAVGMMLIAAALVINGIQAIRFTPSQIV